MDESINGTLRFDRSTITSRTRCRRLRAHFANLIVYKFSKSVLALPSVKVCSAEIARGHNLVAFSVTPAAGARWNYY
jgi:hypothetical protein